MLLQQGTMQDDPGLLREVAWSSDDHESSPMEVVKSSIAAFLQASQPGMMPGSVLQTHTAGWLESAAGLDAALSARTKSLCKELVLSSCATLWL